MRPIVQKIEKPAVNFQHRKISSMAESTVTTASRNNAKALPASMFTKPVSDALEKWLKEGIHDPTKLGDLKHIPPAEMPPGMHGFQGISMARRTVHNGDDIGSIGLVKYRRFALRFRYEFDARSQHPGIHAYDERMEAFYRDTFKDLVLFCEDMRMIKKGSSVRLNFRFDKDQKNADKLCTTTEFVTFTDSEMQHTTVGTLVELYVIGRMDICVDLSISYFPYRKTLPDMMWWDMYTSITKPNRGTWYRGGKWKTKPSVLFLPRDWLKLAVFLRGFSRVVGHSLFNSDVLKMIAGHMVALCSGEIICGDMVLHVYKWFSRGDNMLEAYLRFDAERRMDSIYWQ
jgi:hypothetical protein